MNILRLLTCSALFAWSVISEAIVNRCCQPSQVYHRIIDQCSKERELLESYPFIIQENETSYLTLPSDHIKLLDGHNKSEVKFKIQVEQPERPCYDGYFTQTFCTASDPTQCSEGMAPLLITTRAQLKVNEEYYSPKEFCIIEGDETFLEIRVCNPVCSSEVPCVKKCCDIDKVWDFNNGNRGKKCVASGAKSWRPHFYSSATDRVPSDLNEQIHPHYFIQHPKPLHNKNKTTFLTQEQRDLVSEKLNWLFRIGLDKNYYKRKSRYSWINSAEYWNTSCVDGVINSKYRDSSEFKGTEEEDVLIEIFPIGAGQAASMSSQLGVYSLTMIISAVFLLITFVVHALLWHRQTLHGWTLMSYCASLFLTYVFFVFKYIHSATTTRGEKADGLCVFIGVVINYFFICTFCWLTVQNFDLWLTFRKVQVRPKSSMGVKRYLAYAAFSLAVPLIFIATGLTMDAIYVHEPETEWIIPEYGLLQCGPHPGLAQWVYQSGPAGILFLLNLIFFAATVFSIYKAQAGMSSRNQDFASRAKLFGKLMIAMGVPYIFEFIPSLAEGYESGHVAWYWIILDVLNILQGVFIFVIFVCKKETWNALTEKYVALKRFEITSSVATRSSAMESSSQV